MKALLLSSLVMTAGLFQSAGNNDSIVFRGHKEPVWNVVFSDDGELLASADGQIMIWQLSGTRPHLLHKKENFDGVLASGVRRLSFTRDRSSLVWVNTAGRAVHLWRFSSGAKSPELSFGKQDHAIHDLELAPNGVLLATAGGTQLQVQVWHIGETKPARIAVLGRFSDSVHDVAFSFDSKLLASLAGQSLTADVLVIWDLKSKQILRKIILPPVGWRTLGFSEDGRSILAQRLLDGGKSFTVTSFDLRNGKVTARIEFIGHNGKLRPIQFSPDMKMIVSGDLEGHVAVWDTASGRKLQHWSVPSAVHSAAFSRDGRRIAIGQESGLITLFVVGAR